MNDDVRYHNLRPELVNGHTDVYLLANHKILTVQLYEGALLQIDTRQLATEIGDEY